jgi:hypothetical protein
MATALPVYTALLAGSVVKTLLVPAAKVTTNPLLDEDRMTSLDRVDPDKVYVPMPTSHAPEVPSVIV